MQLLLYSSTQLHFCLSSPLHFTSLHFTTLHYTRRSLSAFVIKGYLWFLLLLSLKWQHTRNEHFYRNSSNLLYSEERNCLFYISKPSSQLPDRFPAGFFLFFLSSLFLVIWLDSHNFSLFTRFCNIISKFVVIVFFNNFVFAKYNNDWSNILEMSLCMLAFLLF